MRRESWLKRVFEVEMPVGYVLATFAAGLVLGLMLR